LPRAADRRSRRPSVALSWFVPARPGPPAPSRPSEGQGPSRKKISNKRETLGNALSNLGGRENGTAKLEEAAAAYREALKEQTRERVPLQWAGAQNNLGNALWRLGERENA